MTAPTSIDAAGGIEFISCVPQDHGLIAPGTEAGSLWLVAWHPDRTAFDTSHLADLQTYRLIRAERSLTGKEVSDFDRPARRGEHIHDRQALGL